MTATEVFARFIAALEAAGIPYMLTGSFASSHHGAPRATQDIDMVVAPDAASLRALASRLPSEAWYFDLEAALAALAREGQFNVLDYATGWKIDCIVRKSRPFSRAEFDRRREVDVAGLRLFVASAEDVVLSKLEWAKRGGSERQVEDVATILRTRRGALDEAWIARWVAELDLTTQWARARLLAGALD